MGDVRRSVARLNESNSRGARVFFGKTRGRAAKSPHNSNGEKRAPLAFATPERLKSRRGGQSWATHTNRQKWGATPHSRLLQNSAWLEKLKAQCEHNAWGEPAEYNPGGVF